MAVYLSLFILDELVRFAEKDPTNEDFVKAMASGILNYYFAAVNGYIVAPKQKWNNKDVDFIIRRIQGRFPGDRSVTYHTLAEAKHASADRGALLSVLESTLDNTNPGLGRFWVIVIHGVNFEFYEYHSNLPKCLIPCETPKQFLSRHPFHARKDSAAIDWILRHMARNDKPPVRGD